MSQDSKVLSRAFLGIGLILLVISAIIFYYHFTFTKSAVHTEGSLLMPFGTTITQTTSMIMVPGIQWLPFALRQITR